MAVVVNRLKREMMPLLERGDENAFCVHRRQHLLDSATACAKTRGLIARDSQRFNRARCGRDPHPPANKRIDPLLIADSLMFRLQSKKPTNNG